MVLRKIKFLFNTRIIACQLTGHISLRNVKFGSNFLYVSLQSSSSDLLKAQMLWGLLLFPYTISAEDSVNASEPETSAEKNLAGIQLWMISGVEKKAF